MIRRRLPIALALTLLLSGCGMFDGVFTDKDQVPLTGERISILQLQQQLVPDPELRGQPVVLPEAWTDTFWPQAGGYPNHAMGHLSLGDNLKKSWDVSIGDGGSRRTPLIVQPIVAAGTVYTMDTKADVSAFDLKTGRRKWRVSTEVSSEDDSGYVGGGLAFASGRVYVTNGHKELVTLDAETGEILWRVVVPAPVRAAPSVADGRVYLLTLDNRLMVYAALDGAPLWSYAGVAEITGLLGVVSPAVNASLVVMPMSSGEVVGLRAENGQVVWQDHLSAVRRSGALSTIADIRGQPVIDQGLVYAVSFSGRMVAIDEVTGMRVWQREIGSADTPWSVGDTVYVLSTDQQMMALRRLDGAIRWISPLPRFVDGDKSDPIIWTGPVLAGNRLIAVNNHGDMAEIDPQTGVVLKTTSLPGKVYVPPVVADNTLLILTDSGKLVAYR